MRSSHPLGLWLGLALSGSPALAQTICVGPDQLNSGICCQILPANLPAFSNVSMPGLGICYTNCQPGTQNLIKVDWPAPTQIQCSEYVTLLTVTDQNSGQPILSGKLHLAYTRSWDEVDPAGNPYQVWRFAAKADLSPVPAGIIPPCPTARCLPPFGTQPTAFYYGYVDYASLCGTIISQNTCVLYHACDFFIHRPGFSDRPGVFHPNEAYAIVAPHSAAQPFVPQLNPSPNGPMLGDVTREVQNFPGLLCMANDRIAGGQVALLGGACLCPPSVVPKLTQFRSIQAQLSCPDPTGVGGSFQSLNLGFPNVLPWFHVMTTNIGCWTNANVYPGKECAWVDEGLFIVNEGCTGGWISVQYGGSTRFGWPIVHPVLFSGMTDLADNYSAPLFGPYPLPLFGSIQPTDRITAINLP